MGPGQERHVFILLSGGLDSTTCAALAASTNPDSMTAISFMYGQKHSAEIEHAQAVADHYGMPLHLIALDPRTFAGGHSALLKEDNVAMPDMTYEELDASYGISPTYVPFRNGVLLSMAAAVATAKAEATEGLCELWFGAHAEDAANWAYPDCTPEFIGAIANAIFIGSYQRVRLVTPLEWMDKTQIVQAGIFHEAPFGLTMSCYNGSDPACGRCPTCMARLKAFEMAGEKDPIAYAEDAKLALK